MSARRLRSVLALVAFVAALAKLVQALRGDPTSTFADHPSNDAVRAEPEAEPSPIPAPIPVVERVAEAVLAPVTPTEAPDPEVPAHSGPAAGPVTEADLEPGPVAAEPVDLALATTEAPTPLFADERDLPATPPTIEPVEVVAAEVVAAGATTWVDPVEGGCPDGYPVKAKVKSGIFHLPGMAFYDRTAPDRCYPTAEAAVADGLRPAKR
ncbi:hypothetical protein KSP35_10020 [Aquihabitans sp. G128]|uniref:sunset domain-containing protein n=1 Tax=Aquihabitans sp. G128 TaxID=2849779 RepID=UPI001C218E26|nr:hypothetical protein [Aquihabitans sp. G128]QXC63080.1 hypothetical protein KSP35_10020 [Aquihabitans sp. G128]